MPNKQTYTPSIMDQYTYYAPSTVTQTFEFKKLELAIDANQLNLEMRVSNILNKEGVSNESKIHKHLYPNGKLNEFRAKVFLTQYSAIKATDATHEKYMSETIIDMCYIAHEDLIEKNMSVDGIKYNFRQYFGIKKAQEKDQEHDFTKENNSGLKTVKSFEWFETFCDYNSTLLEKLYNQAETEAKSIVNDNTSRSQSFDSGDGTDYESTSVLSDDIELPDITVSEQIDAQNAKPSTQEMFGAGLFSNPHAAVYNRTASGSIGSTDSDGSFSI